MKIYENGIIREASQEEIDKLNELKEIPEQPEISLQEQIDIMAAAMEDMISMMMEGGE